jgi:asparagine synthase (glutamine-hydrolysing)
VCGIAGLFDFRRQSGIEDVKRHVTDMADALRHRGPDQGGAWADEGAGIALGHRRLSIQDLSPAGAQPMASACGRFVLVYNGEGYNAGDLRTELAAAGVTFRGHSDTEVLAEGFSAWGVEQTVARFNGMFAFAVWDRQARQLVLGRDRLGIKPLYWTARGGRLMFASELKAMRAVPGWDPALNRDAVAAFLRHNYIPAPHTIYQGVFKLEPGHLLTVDAEGTCCDRTYWNARDVALADRVDIGEAEAVQRLEALLTDAVQRQMVSDVPLGAFLSGGVDSSVVVALMRARGANVRTFSIGFDEGGYDESQHAAQVARHLGTDHTELRFSERHLLDLVPRMALVYDEPFGDSSQLPTLLLSQLARSHLTVALTGDGGDEVFAGYNRYFWGRKLRRLTAVPAPVRGLAARMLTAVPTQTWDGVAKLAPARLRVPQAGDKAHKLASVLTLNDMGLYRRLVSHWEQPDRIVQGGHEPASPLWDDSWITDFPDPVARMQALDTVTYLPDDILTKVDRASMAVSLETRVPLLDHRVVEFAWTLPRHLLVRNGGGKWLLRQVLHRHVPSALVERPKMGFGVPIGQWLKGPLRDWAEDLLNPRRMEQTGLLNAAPITRCWDEHLSGQRNWQYPLWDVLMLESWRRHWMEAE